MFVITFTTVYANRATSLLLLGPPLGRRDRVEGELASAQTRLLLKTLPKRNAVREQVQSPHEGIRNDLNDPNQLMGNVYILSMIPTEIMLRSMLIWLPSS